MIEQDGLPSRRLEGQRPGIRVGRLALASGGTLRLALRLSLSLRERGNRPDRHGKAEGLQQLPARDASTVVFVK